MSAKRSEILLLPAVLKPAKSLTAGEIGATVSIADGQYMAPATWGSERLMDFPRFAATAVFVVNKIPTLFWAAWIVAVVVGSAVVALNAPALG